MQDTITITGRPAAAVFASIRQRKIVQTLMGEELTLGALAVATQTPLGLLHYHVSKCIRLGLLEVVREQRRAGRAVKHYRATARTFFLPAELVVEMPGTGLSEHLRAALDQNLAKSLRGLNFTHDGCSPRAHLVRDPGDHTAALELWLDVGLSSVDAEALASEMQAVANRFRARGDNREPRYLVHLVAVRI